MSSSIIEMQADEDFNKARSKALINEIQHFLNPKSSQLLSFSDIKKMVRPSGEIYRGMQVIPVNLIVGSEGRYRDFDNHFFPKNIHLRARWKNIDKAHLTDVILPPIVLYELGGLYFVRDGNHRVSVAKAQGIENIDAEVISLQSEIKLKAGMSASQIQKQIIQYEKRVFYSETCFGDITDCWNLNFTTPGQYDIIYNHILIHKYYINQPQPEEISLADAILSWYRVVYLPVINVILRRKIMKKFRTRTPSDMYVWIIRYWDDLKQQFGDSVSLDTVAQDFTKEYGTGFWRHILEKIKSFFHS